MKKNPVLLCCIGFILMIVVGCFLEKRELEKASMLQKSSFVYFKGNVIRMEGSSPQNHLYLYIETHHNPIKEGNFSILWNYQTWMVVLPVQFPNEYQNNIKLGDEVWVRGELVPFSHARNQGEFSEFLYLYTQGIRYKIKGEQIEKRKEGGWKVRNKFFVWNRKIKEVVRKELGDYYGGAVIALLLGEKKEMNPELKDLFTESGIGHLFVISGLHISLLGWGIYQSMKRMFRSRIVSGCLLAFGLACYILLIGFQISFIRAICFLVFQVGEDILGRKADKKIIVLVSVACILGIQPRSIFQGGFYLSYGSVLGGWYGKKLWKGDKRKEKRGLFSQIQRKVAGSFQFSLGIYSCLLPLLLFFFYEVSGWGVLWNLISVPLAAPLFLCSCLGLLFAERIGGVFWSVSRGILQFYEKGSRIFLNLPFGRVVLGRPPIWILLCYFCCLFVLIRWKAKRGKNALALLLLCLCCFFGWKGIGRNEVRITVLDVGQGDGILIQGPNRGIYFVDGGSLNVPNLGKRRLLPFLKYNGIQRVDYVFLSHGDRDHYSGILDLLEEREEVRVEHLVFPEEKYWDDGLREVWEAGRKAKVEGLIMKEGDVLQEGDLCFTCLYPFLEQEKNQIEVGNQTSMVLELEVGRFQMLFTGDLEKEGEKLFLEKEGSRYREDSLEILKAGHHGSKFSSSEEFLKEIQPKITIFSAGERNPYGHPHKETIERLQGIKSESYQTKEWGEIDIYVNGKEFRIQGYLENLK